MTVASSEQIIFHTIGDVTHSIDGHVAIPSGKPFERIHLFERAGGRCENYQVLRRGRPVTSLAGDRSHPKT